MSSDDVHDLGELGDGLLDGVEDVTLDFLAYSVSGDVHEPSGFGVVHDPEALIARRCARCRTGYAADVILPYVVLMGADLPRYYDRDTCVVNAGFAMLPRLRAMLGDYGFSWPLVVDGAGHPVDADTYTQYAPPIAVRWDADDRDSVAQTIATFSAFLAATGDDAPELEIDQRLLQSILARLRQAPARSRE